MIRKVCLQDAAAIAEIYNEYVMNTAITFETEPVSTEEMQTRIAAISGSYPYLAYETENEVAGYCYAHLWKSKAAYQYTLETTIYLSPRYTGKGIGQELLQHLTEECRKRGFHALIACITEGNEASFALYRKFGFQQVSHFHKVGMKFERWLDVFDYELILES